MSLPGPHVVMGSLADNLYSVSVWSAAAWTVTAVLLCRAAVRLASGWRSWLRDDARRVVMVLLLWGILHNLAYMIFLPVPGTASRYGALNHVLLWIALVAGLVTFLHRPRLQLGLLCALIAVAIANTLFWNRVYDANLDHMQNVRMQAARFVRQTLPADALCAAFDVGALRYFSGRPIVDLGGLIDPNAAYVFKSGAADRYLLQRGVSCLILPGAAGRSDQGLFDVARIMGLSTSPIVELHLLRSFQIDRARWLLGYLPTLNYQASVSIYQIQRAPASP